MLFLSRNKFVFALVCNIVYAGQLFMTKGDIIPRRWRHASIFWHKWSSLLNGLSHRLTIPRPSLATTPAYNKEDNLPVRTGLQHRGRFIYRLARDWFQLHHGDHQLHGDNYWPDASGEIHPVYFILYIASFKIAITLACKFSSAGQVISLRRWMIRTGLYHDQMWRISRQLLESS